MTWLKKAERREELKTLNPERQYEPAPYAKDANRLKWVFVIIAFSICTYLWRVFH